MFCHKCGQELPEGAKFCTSCGECIVKEGNKKENSYKKNPFKKALKVFLIVVGVLFLLAIVGKIIESIVGFETSNSGGGQSGSEIVDSADEGLRLIDEMYGIWYPYGEEGDEHYIVIDKNGDFTIVDGPDKFVEKYNYINQETIEVFLLEDDVHYIISYVDDEQLIAYDEAYNQEAVYYVKEKMVEQTPELTDEQQELIGTWIPTMGRQEEHFFVIEEDGTFIWRVGSDEWELRYTWEGVNSVRVTIPDGKAYQFVYNYNGKLARYTYGDSEVGMYYEKSE